MADAEPMDAQPARHPGTVQLLRWFDYQHLPADLGVVSMQFHHLAHELVDRLPDSPELTVALRKLLEGKDAAVRAALPPPGTRTEVQRPAVVQQVMNDSAARTLTVGVACPADMAPEELAEQVRLELLERLERSAAEQSRMPSAAESIARHTRPRAISDSPQA